MSFADLPTETFDNVIGLLPHSDINALSLVSRGFRAAAEPHLYRNLLFYKYGRHSILWLLLTLLRPRELAMHIKTIHINGTRNPPDASRAFPPPGPERLYEYLDEDDTQKAFRRTIEEICGSGPDMAKAWITWFGALLTANHLSSLTMLACMAVNIESIILGTAPDYYRHKNQYVGSTTNTNGMDSVIEDVLRMSYVPSPQVRRLGSLKALHVYTGVRTNLCIVPSLEKIKTMSSHLSKCKSIGKDINLREVEIVDSLMDVSFNLGGILELSPNITRVVCREIIYKPELVAACQQLVDVMSVNCLGLVELELSFESYRDPVHPLQNLDQLGALKTLCIDAPLLTGENDYRSTLFDGDYLLPPKLGTLILTNIPEVSRVEIDQVIETMSNSGVGAMRDIPPMFFVKELAWVVRLSLMQGQQVLQNMHKLAVELYSKFGTEFKAYRYPANLEAAGRLRADKDGIRTRVAT